MEFERALFGRGLLPLSYRIAGRTSLRLFQELVRNQTLHPEQVADLQFRKLKALLEHAYRNVPFYRRRFDEVHLQPADIRSLDDYAQLPILTKRDLRENLEDLVATNVKSVVLFSTGGSTGAPVDYYHDARYAYEVASAGMWRSWLWAGFYLGERHLHIWGGPREAKESRSIKRRLTHFLLRRLFIDAFDLSDQNLSDWMRGAKKFRPVFVYGYASSVAALASYVRQKGEYLPGIRAAMTTAECLLPQQRQVISEAFGCKVYDQYACREVRSVASECSHGSLHVATDLNVVEFLDLPDQPPDAPKLLALTPLELWGAPLLRYVNEDYGLPGTPCDCSLPFPAMQLKVGRISDNFLLPSGRLVHGEYFTHLVYGVQGIQQFQFHQIARDRILFRIVTDPVSFDTESEHIVRQLVTEAETYLGEGVKIELMAVNQIPLTASGKHRFTLSDVNSTLLVT